MAKFIITQTYRYVVEAENMAEAQAEYKADMIDGSFDKYDYIDGSTTYEEANNEL